jgi:hypothetical protein
MRRKSDPEPVWSTSRIYSAFWWREPDFQIGTGIARPKPAARPFSEWPTIRSEVQVASPANAAYADDSILYHSLLGLASGRRLLPETVAICQA